MAVPHVISFRFLEDNEEGSPTGNEINIKIYATHACDSNAPPFY